MIVIHMIAYQTPNKKGLKKKSGGKFTAKTFKKTSRLIFTRQIFADGGKTRVIVDSGTNLEVLGGVGWHVLSRINDKKTAVRWCTGRYDRKTFGHGKCCHCIGTYGQRSWKCSVG